MASDLGTGTALSNRGQRFDDHSNLANCRGGAERIVARARRATSTIVNCKRLIRVLKDYPDPYNKPEYPCKRVGLERPAYPYRLGNNNVNDL